METTNQKIIILEDHPVHFEKIADILENSGCKILWDINKAKNLMADFDASENCSPAFVQIHEDALKEKVELIKKQEDPFWIIDINWTGNPTEADADEYGLMFRKKFDITKAVMLSVNPKTRYKNTLRGLKYVSKFDDSQKLFSEVFEKNILKALDIDPIKGRGPYDNTGNK